MAKPEGIIKVAVAGAAGKMGAETVRALCAASREFELVLATDVKCVGESLASVAGVPGTELKVTDKLGAGLEETQPHVLIDFTHASGAAAHAQSALKRGVAVVIGTSGLSNSDLQEIKQACAEFSTPALLVPNFAMGAVLMMRFSQIAAKWMPDVEVIEMHHDQKIDAPSGTALRTAELISDARGDAAVRQNTKQLKVEGVLGGMCSGIPVHSVRLQGLLAHQMVMFGGPGETLTIRHDSMDRASFMTGVKLAVRHVWDLSGLVVGLDKLLFRD